MGVHENILGKAGAGDMFLKVTGAVRGLIKGEAGDDKHKDEIEILSWSWSMQARPSLADGSATGRATIRELQVVKRVDRSSTNLMLALRSNETIKEAVLTIRKIGKDPLEYLFITINDGRVVGYEVEAGDPAGGTNMLERVAFSFNKIEVKYVPQGPDGLAQGTLSFQDQWSGTS